MSYSETLEQALIVVRQQAVLMQKCIQQRKLMDALKHASMMLTELRKPDLSPKQYYELYIMVFDSLSLLSSYLTDNHPKIHHLADLYELVQYAGNVVPRLYLMITVGTSYLKCTDSPREEILKDMIEMCRGVQNPMRGLFLRYYLSQRTKQLLPDNAIEFNSNFVINNFIEMNKLWVRLQHQGPLKEREQRTKERKELQILIGSQLVRLSQIVDDNLVIYKDNMLPVILEQVVQCRDVVSQEYLLDVVCQVFPDEFHLSTLDSLLGSTLHMNPDVSINKNVLTLIDRLNGYIDRKEQEQEQDTIQGNSNLFEVFWNYLKTLNEERPDLSLHQFIPLVESIMALSLRWYPDNLSNLNILYGFTAQKCRDYGRAIPQNAEYLFANLLILQNFRHVNRSAALFYNIISQCDAFRELLSLQNMVLQKNIIDTLLDILLSASRENEILFVIDSKASLEKLLSVMEPLIRFRVTSTTRRFSNDALGLSDDLTEDEEGNSSWVLDPSQEKLAQFCHLSLRLLPIECKQYLNVENQVEYLLLLRNWYYRGDKNIKYTYPAIISNFWKLIRKSYLLKTRQKLSRKTENDYSNMIKQLFKYASRCINDLFNVCGSSVIDTVYKLNIQSASLADQLSIGEIAYDFFSQAFTVFEESLSDLKTQFQALVYMIQSLQKTRSLYQENYYDTLIVRCTLHGSRLLRKQDQCRAVYLCSHLWWATEIAVIGEEEGTTADFYREGKRVLECLQRSLRVADSTMDNIQSCQLMVEILNRCLYYFIHGDEHDTHVSVKYINGLIELIKTNLRSLKLEEQIPEQQQSTTRLQDLHIDGQDSTELSSRKKFVMGLDGTYIEIPRTNGSPASISNKLNSMYINEMIYIPLEHFDRTCEYIVNQREIDDRFKVIVV
ncbi:vacuolar protein sorting-associated protein 35 [Zygosaccharomyces mellis]|uniref:Vacuolar protein sorting-associated protein 35 n=1 Tax=Zygosaccharomyces mellis TaxID=42258 RepID=A0A4C2E058_9SACH|nr:vacuolar protein sorting-associated protein 35 [Zygosaccharomyces mellis]